MKIFSALKEYTPSKKKKTHAIQWEKKMQVINLKNTEYIFKIKMANKQVKRCSKSLGKCKSKPQ